MASDWFPSGQNDTPGWRLDIVSLLAVIGESSMAEHAQALTASWMCCLPRIIPAPQVLLKPTRPTRMPQVNAAVVGVKNGTLVPTLNYFPNIIHPIEELKPFEFRVYEINHKKSRLEKIERKSSMKKPLPGPKDASSNGSSIIRDGLPAPVTSGLSITPPDKMGLRQRGTNDIRQVHTRSNEAKLPPHVPAKLFSPLNGLSVFSCALTIGLFVMAVLKQDGVACLALVTISLASSIVGFASLWSPQLMKRNSLIEVPNGDVVIRTREGAFIVVKCDENVARELYTGTEECVYTVQNKNVYRFLVGVGTFFLMVSVVLLGNCNFPLQLAIGASYIALNGLYWGAALINKKRFWDLDLYDWVELTNNEDYPRLKGASLAHDGDIAHPDPEQRPSFTRTMWYAIRETEEIGWVKKSGAAPVTNEWDTWLKAALAAAQNFELRDTWKAVTAKDRMVGQTESTAFSPASPVVKDEIAIPGGQQAPDIKVPPNDRM